jgi:hypothetical protein
MYQPPENLKRKTIIIKNIETERGLKLPALRKRVRKLAGSGTWLAVRDGRTD